MPMVMESSMFWYSVGRLIADHNNVGFNFVKAHGTV